MTVRFSRYESLLMACIVLASLGTSVQAEEAKSPNSRTAIYSPPSGWGCKVQLDNLDKLAAKAEESSEVSLSGPMLGLASKFLSSKKGDEAKAKDIISGLKGVYVRTFEFAKDGTYSQEDLRAIREQIRGGAWSRLVSVKSKGDGETVDVCACLEGGQISGLAIIAAEPRELSIVNIVGPIDLEKLSAVGGQFGIPELDLEADTKRQAGNKPKTE